MLDPGPIEPLRDSLLDWWVSNGRHDIPWKRHPDGSRPRSGEPLDPFGVWVAEVIQHLHNTLRSLPRPLLESLTRAFRKRFQVPEEAVTIADRINQKCHHDWIEAFLVSHREVRQAEQR